MNKAQFKNIRLSMGVSQQEFGEALGFSKKWARMRISEIECGRKKVSKRTEALCGALNKIRGGFMRKSSIVLISLLLCLKGYALTNDRPNVNFGLEVLGSGGAADSFEKDANELVGAINSAGVPDLISGEVTSYPGIGVTAGITLPKKNDYELGVQIGYGVGAEVVQDYRNNSFTWNPTGQQFGRGAARITTSSTYTKLLLEGAKLFSLSKLLKLRLSAKAGLAKIDINQKLETSGSASSLISLLNIDIHSEEKESVTGMAWEISPSLVLPYNSVEFEAGLKYSHYPTKSESGQISKFEWNPVGLFIGMRF